MNSYLAPPPEWSAQVAQLDDGHRVVIALSYGRGPYKVEVDSRVRVTIVEAFEEVPELRQLVCDAVDSDGSPLDLAAALYRRAVESFLEHRSSSNGEHPKMGKLRFSIFDRSDREIATIPSALKREAFAEEAWGDDDPLEGLREVANDGGAVQVDSLGGARIVHATNRLLSDLVKSTVGQNQAFAALLLRSEEQSRESTLTYVRGALEVAADAHEIRAAALVQAAQVEAQASQGSFWNSAAGEAIGAQAQEVLGVLLALGKKFAS